MEDSRTKHDEAYRQSGWYNGEAIDALNRRLEGYTTDYDTLKARAEAEYAPTYGAERDALSARLASQTAAAAGERAAVNRSYDRMRRLTGERYDQSEAALNNTLNARGLGRSSLTATKGAYLEGERGRALGDLDRAEADDIAAINSRIARLTEETARSQQTLASNYAQQLDRRIEQLRSSNQDAAVSLQLQIAALQQQGYEAWQNWQQKERAEAREAEMARQNLALKERAQALDEEEFRQKYGRHSGAGGGASQKTASGSSKNRSSGGSDKGIAGLIQAALKGARALTAGAAKKSSAAGVSAIGRSAAAKVAQK